MSTQKRKYELRARAEQREETRRRIVEATEALHQEVGPAQTTVADIARRAGVTRVTVYKHFPEEQQLFAACQQSFLSDNPTPDFAPALSEQDPHSRLYAVLHALYESYRAREPMTAKVLRDRSVLPALDELMRQTMDAQLAGLADALAGPFRARGRNARRLRALIALAVDFWTWKRLKDEGLDDAGAAELMADVVTCVDSRPHR